MNLPSPTLLTTTLPALALLAFGAPLLRRARRSAAWPRTPGTILEARVVRQGNASSPRLTYRYRLGAEGRVGHRLWVGPSSVAVTGDWADGVVARYPVGATVQVAVDPDDPAYAVLEPGPRALHWLLLVVAAAMLVVGVLIGLVAGAAA